MSDEQRVSTDNIVKCEDCTACRCTGEMAVLKEGFTLGEQTLEKKVCDRCNWRTINPY